jgi:D-alanyl-D-alanine carboxypeptidase/D-alanyl-D-alanine-endopeptidase (penicillin-binding protein 4)
MKSGRRSALLRCAALVLLAAASAPAARLPQEIDRLISSSKAARSAFWGIQVVDLETGQTLYELNPDRLFVPASNGKLFTAAMALARLGPNLTFRTRVLSESEPDAQGRIAGPLVLAGGGDPNLSGRPIPYRESAPPGDPLAALDDLAAQLVARGVTRVDGGIIGDDTWYVWQPYPPGWAVDDPLYDYGAPVSALTVHDNTLALAIRPGTRPGDLGALTLTPPVEYYRFDNRVRTAPLGVERKLSFSRDPGSAQVRVWGTIPVRDRGESFLLGIEDPAEYAAVAFRQVLQARGITVTGPAVARHLFPNEAGDLKTAASALPQPAGVTLAARDSAPLIEALRILCKASQNLHAEMMLRAVARARRGIGSLEAGLEELKSFGEETGIPPESIELDDGSGLGRLSLVSPAAVMTLLRHMYDSPMRDQWISVLPVAGEEGTLSARFAGSAASGQIFAKTGTLSHVSALSGYGKRAGGGMVAFTILVNNYLGPDSEIRGVMDRICTLIVE